MSITTFDDVKVALVDPALDVDADIVNALIGRAERIIEHTGFDLKKLDPEIVRMVVSSMVKRVILNPDGIRQETETTGPGSRSVTYAGSDPGMLYISEHERELLIGKRRSGAFTINLAPRAMQDYPTYGVVGW